MSVFGVTTSLIFADRIIIVYLKAVQGFPSPSPGTRELVTTAGRACEHLVQVLSPLLRRRTVFVRLAVAGLGIL